MLEALGDLGDFLGGIGVMITVIYLALQIRHNTRGMDQNNDLMQLSFENEMRHEMMQFRLGIATDEGLTELWTRGVAGLSELSPSERDRFDMLMYNVLSMMNAQFDAHSRGLYERGRADRFGPRDFTRSSAAPESRIDDATPLARTKIDADAIPPDSGVTKPTGCNPWDLPT